MGNQQGKTQRLSQSGKPKKMVHWKSAERPLPPGRPILMTLPEQQPDVVNLSWEKPKQDGGSPITGYVIEHRRMGSPHWVRSLPILIVNCEVSISGLEPGWRYQFRAFAENVVGRSDPSELSDPLTVTLQRNAICAPRFIDELTDTNGVEDERIEFRVHFVGHPHPEINWFKDGYEIFSSRRTKIINENDVSVLIIHQLALSDEGEIKCTATNRAGHVATKARLVVQAPPKIRLPRTYEDGIIIEAEEILRLKVGVAGQPAPVVAWMHDGNLIPNGGRFEILTSDKNSMLKIDGVQRKDRGEYSVSALNPLGEDVTSFLVTVTSKPDPPGKVRLNMSFGKSATLSWTAPLDDGGCKVGSYILEYYRIGWNVWLKAMTTRSLSTTLHDLIEGSEYKFRVKAENPYGVSEPSEESDILFVPDPKRGIMKPKSENILNIEDEERKPVPPRRKTLSPSRPLVDASTETPRLSPLLLRKPKPQVLDNDDLHREMSYGTPDQILKINVRKSPSLNNAELTMQNTKANEEVLPEKPTTPAPITTTTTTPTTATIPTNVLSTVSPTVPKTLPTPVTKTVPTPAPTPTPTTTTKPASVATPTPIPTSTTASVPAPPTKSPQSKAFAESIKAQLFAAKKDKDQSKDQEKPNSLSTKIPLATPERSATPEIKPSTSTVSAPNLHTPSSPVKTTNKDKLSPKLGILKKIITSPEPIANTPALQRSAEPVDLGVNQTVRRYSGQSLSPIKNAPALAIAIATGINITDDNFNNMEDTNQNTQSPENQKTTPSANPTIEISAPPPSTPEPDVQTPLEKSQKPTAIEKQVKPSPRPLYDRQDDVHTSNEFMVVVFDKNSKVKDKNKQDSFDLDLEDALQPPPVSISAPELASLEYHNLQTFPLRLSVSSTELLYERAMARFYEAVEMEEAEKAEKLRKASYLDDKLLPQTNTQTPIIRKRLASMTEAERISFERRSEHRRQSSDIVQDLKTPIKWGSRDNLNYLKPLTRASGMMLQDRQISQESQESQEPIPEKTPALSAMKSESFDLGSDYTESTASSDDDSIERFKMELLARTRSPSPRELETYHPRDMSAGVFTPYRAPTPEQAAIVLTRPMPLPSPDFVPKPILKRPSIENVQSNGSNTTLNGNGNASGTGNGSTQISPEKNSNGGKDKSDKLDITKGIKSFFKRDKRSTTEKNTEENERLTNPLDKNMAAALAAEEEAKRKAKEEEERKRKEAERLMMEEAHAAVDHYSDLVKEISTTHKYHKPIYLDKEELKKVAAKASQDDLNDEDADEEIHPLLKQKRDQSPDDFLAPPVSNKPRLSISERGQFQFVRETASDLAVKDKKIIDSSSEQSEQSQQSTPRQTFSRLQDASRLPYQQLPPQETQAPLQYPQPVQPPFQSVQPMLQTTPLQPFQPPLQQPLQPPLQQPIPPPLYMPPPNQQPFHPSHQLATAPHLPLQAKAQPIHALYQASPIQDDTRGQIISETYVENPDGRGRTRIVKVKRIIKRRVPSRSRETSGSRPPSSVSSVHRVPLDHAAILQQHYEQQQHKQLQLQQQYAEQLGDLSATSASKDLAQPEDQQLLEPYNFDNTHEKVRSAVSYSTDLILFIVACYVYLFKDARLVLPILALMIYRQLGEVISAHIPNWMKRKRN